MNRIDRNIFSGAALVALIVACHVGILLRNDRMKARPTLVIDGVTDQEVLGHNREYLGDQSSRSTLIVFFDYECQPCKKVNGSIHDMVKSNPSFKIIFHNFPLPFHKNSMYAASVAEQSRLEGKFWQVHDELFLNQSTLSPEKINKIAATAGVKVAYGSVEDKSARVEIAKEIEIAKRMGVNFTPSFFISPGDGRVIRVGQPDQIFDFVK